MNHACDVPQPVSAVPVLPATLTPGIETPFAWPLSTTDTIRSRIVFATPALTIRFCCGLFELLDNISPMQRFEPEVRRFDHAAVRDGGGDDAPSGAAWRAARPARTRCSRAASVVSAVPGAWICVGAVSSVNGRAEPKPNFSAVSQQPVPAQACTPTCAKIAFTENAKACENGYVPVPCATLSQEIGKPSMTIWSGQVTVVSGVTTPFSSAEWQ